ncbi:hypothetical protein [Lysobacter firmicutimachus]|uniref:DUF1631 family protein n=1 Tax=Lysobacter firmicutimachus TaxID=1792846 RepID=A0ABU8D0Q8_9GAMM
MRHTTDKTPEATARHADHSAGTDRKASTVEKIGSLLAAHARAAVTYLDAAQERYLAEARQRRAMAAAMRLNPLLPRDKRHQAAASAEVRAGFADDKASHYAARAAQLRALNPELQPSPQVRVVIAAQVNRIDVTAYWPQGQGAALTQSRERLDAHLWLITGAHWGDHLETLGPALCEFLDGLPMALDVADSLRCGASEGARHG